MIWTSATNSPSLIGNYEEGLFDSRWQLEPASQSQSSLNEGAAPAQSRSTYLPLHDNNATHRLNPHSTGTYARLKITCCNSHQEHAVLFQNRWRHTQSTVSTDGLQQRHASSESLCCDGITSIPRQAATSRLSSCSAVMARKAAGRGPGRFKDMSFLCRLMQGEER